MAASFHHKFFLLALCLCPGLSAFAGGAGAQQLVQVSGAPPAQAAAAAAAPTGSPYTIESVVVDVTAKNAVMAREKALSEAQVKAYRMLAERFLPPEQMASFKSPSADTVSLLVQDYEVTNEQLSTKRYKGTFTIRFRPNAMRAQMASQGKTYSDKPSRPVLVLPFYRSGARTTLWSADNGWFSAWRAAPAGDAFHPLILPAGDAEDRGNLNDELGVEADPALVADMARRYNAGDVAMVVAGDANAQGLPLDLYTLGANGPVFVQKMNVSRNPADTERALYARAVEAVKGKLRNNWKADMAYGTRAPTATVTTTETIVYGGASPYPAASRQPAVPLGPLQTYNAIVRFATVQEWVRMKSALDRLYGMKSTMIRTLKPREAALDMRFAGDSRALQMALQGAGLTATSAPGGLVLIDQAGAPR